MTTTQKLDATAVARSCAEEYVSVDHVLTDDSLPFDVIYLTLLEERAGDDDYLPPDERQQLMTRLLSALPEEKRDDLCRLDPANRLEQSCARRAGFILGCEMARAMRGGVR